MFWPSFLVSIIGVVFVTMLFVIWYRRRLSKKTNRASGQRGIRQYLLGKNLTFSAIVVAFGAAVVFVLTIFLSTQALVAQIAAGSHLASARLTEFQSRLEDELARFGDEEALVVNDKANAARALGRLYRAARHFQRVVLVNDEESIIYAYPPEESGSSLTEQEIAAVSAVLRQGNIERVISNLNDAEQIVSIVMPVQPDKNQPASVIIGRVSISELAGLIDISDDEGHFSSYIFDKENRLIVHTGAAIPAGKWQQGPAAGDLNLNIPEGIGGQAFLYKNPDQSQDLIYIAPRTRHSWYVATGTPFNVVINRSLLFAASFAAVLSFIGVVYHTQLDRYGRSLSAPLSELVKTSRSIAKGGTLTTRVYTNRQDEIGELTHAFTDMQLALKGRLDELSLLLSVTQDISSSINITQSMPVILQGALRGTGAAGARILILDPSGKVPLSFTEGPAGSDLAPFDRSLMVLLREHKELALGSPRQIQAKSGVLPVDSSPIKALYALPLLSNGSFRGILFVGYRQVREFSISEQTLLRTLAGQATVLVDNAYLFANAEGGRRRLAAVLGSMTEAVIVTDQTDRILVINRAMENAFQLTSSRIKGRMLADVIESKQLVEALTQEKVGKLDLEIEGKDSRSYFVNVSPIISQTGLMMGRVAILTDVTRYKEIDRLKSDFVSNVSHDLRTPLTVMSGFTAALFTTENLSSEQRKYAENIARSVEYMTGMVETLLDLGRIEAGVDLLFEEVDIMALLYEVADEHWMYAHEAGIDLRVTKTRGLPPVVADKSLLNQAISNYLTNGYKYAPNSGEMILSAVQDGDEIVISVRDHGPGIAGQDQIRLFEKFYKVKRPDSAKVKGTGLGLGLVKSIANRHGGRVWCRSELGKGSTFYISLPLKRNNIKEFLD